MVKYILLGITMMLAIKSSATEKEFKIKSPSKKLELRISENNGAIALQLLSFLEPVVTVNSCRFIVRNNILCEGYTITGTEKYSKNETWEPLYGEQKQIKNQYNEMVFTLKDENNPIQDLKLVCRVFDEGIAFRYVFDSASAANISLEVELTTFDLYADHDCWTSAKAQSEITKTTIGNIKSAVERPLLIKRTPTSYLALAEAALVDYARMKFSSSSKTALQVQLDGDVNIEQAGYQSPWRYIMVAESPGKLLENNALILNLNEPNKIKDTSWIRPGKVIREVTLTNQGAKACVDFAADHNLQYIEFDAGWYGHEYDDNEDATTITVDPDRSPGPLDLLEIIEYAKNKDVGVILYINQRALGKQLDDVLPLYKSWGIKGLKYGFVNVGPQKWTSWLHNAIRKAADYEMMVDIHDEYRPTGYSRTYPNLMTQEGIRGDEESPSVEQTLNTLFTRMIAGAADNTNCYFTDRVSKKMGGKTGQMAKSILLYSPWQFIYWYDRPEGSPRKKGGAGSSESIIQEGADLDFYKVLPTVWDDTKVLEGSIGEYATIARKSGENWFVGSLAANNGRKVEVPLHFLDKKKQYEATIYWQNKNDLVNNTVRIEKLLVNSGNLLTKTLPANSGMAIIIKKQ